MRKIGVSFNTYYEASVEETAKLLKKIGFEAVMIGYHGRELTAEKCNAAKAEGLHIDHIHAPFDGINAMWLPGEEGEVMLNRLMECVDFCAEFGVKKTVVHISSGVDAPQVCDLGLARFDRLQERAREKEVTICYENQRKVANLAVMLERYPEAAFCWDTGHEACFTPGKEFMPIFGDRIQCIHTHDNDAEYQGDTHLIPGDGSLDFGKITDQLRKAGFDQPLVMECFIWLNGQKPKSLELYGKLTQEEFYQRVFDGAVKVRTLLDGE